MKNKITVIIPTYERPTYINRALYYWMQYPVNIIVLDGSRKPSIEINDFKFNENLIYAHMHASIEERLSYAASILKGDYAAQISDDEFFSYTALVEASRILDSQKHVSAVLGATIAFKKIKNNFLCSFWYPTAQLLDISATTPFERLMQRCSVQGNSIYYPLVRVETMQKALQFVGEYHYSCPYIAEYQMEAVFCALGSVKVMSNVMWFRSLEVPMINNLNNNRDKFFYDWIQDKSNATEVERLRKSCDFNFEKICGYGNITGEQFIEVFSEFEKNMITTPKMRKKLISIIPPFIKEKIRFLIIKFSKKNDMNFKTISQIKIDLKSINLQFNDQDIDLVAKFVTVGNNFYVK